MSNDLHKPRDAAWHRENPSAMSEALEALFPNPEDRDAFLSGWERVRQTIDWDEVNAFWEASVQEAKDAPLADSGGSCEMDWPESEPQSSED